MRQRNPTDDAPIYYPDTGCRLQPSCLSCALPVCILDVPPHRTRRVYTAQRDAAIIADLRAGADPVTVAVRHQVSKRTVYRTLAHERQRQRETSA